MIQLTSPEMIVAVAVLLIGALIRLVRRMNRGSEHFSRRTTMITFATGQRSRVIGLLAAERLLTEWGHLKRTHPRRLA